MSFVNLLTEFCAHYKKLLAFKVLMDSEFVVLQQTNIATCLKPNKNK